MAEYGNAISMPCKGLTLAVDPEVRSNAELTLAFNYATAQAACPELLGHPYSVLEGPVGPVYESWEEDEYGDLVGVGPPVGWTRQIGWYVNTGVDSASN